jgi:translation initiation factor IF-3
MIRIPQVRVVDEEGAQLGVMPTAAALQMAQERGYDLVEVAPMAAPPVVKFLDFGQYKYELTKRDKENKRRQRSVTFKEIRLSPKIGVGDFETKVHRAIEFLEDGDRIKVTVRFRGRELTHPELGRNMLARFGDQVKDHGVVERAPLLEGKSMHVTVASLHKPKAHDAPQPSAARAGGDPRANGASPEGTAEHATGPETRPAAGAPAAATKAAAPAAAATTAPTTTPAAPAAATAAAPVAASPAAPAATTTTAPAPAARGASEKTLAPATPGPKTAKATDPVKRATRPATARTTTAAKTAQQPKTDATPSNGTAAAAPARTRATQTAKPAETPVPTGE